MAQANTHNITLASSRRRFLTVAAASAVSATALAAAAMPSRLTCTPLAGKAGIPMQADPIHAAIESHAAALRAQEVFLRAQEGLPDELFEAAEEAALALVTVRPTTAAGLARLLRHVSEYEAAGNEWPTFRDDEADMRNREFAFFLHRNLAAALPI